MTALDITDRQLCFVAGALVLAYAEERVHCDRMRAAAHVTTNAELRRIFVLSATEGEYRMAEIRGTVAALPPLGQKVFETDLAEIDGRASA